MLDFLGADRRRILFFPYAGVTISFDAYFERVAERFAQLGHDTISAHQVQDRRAAMTQCDAIAVGGGNTFQLINYLQDGWMQLIRERVQSGTPYIGWSAGSNVACPTIKTTNDMPIMEPAGFEALGLVSFQINPHYTEAQLPDHGGETRPDRIREYIEVNQHSHVMGVPEGALLHVEGNEVVFRGRGSLSVFAYRRPVRTFSDGAIIE